MTFAEFASQIEAAGLNSRDCGNGHWQVTGGQKIVNCWPDTKNGPKVHVNGDHARVVRRDQFTKLVIDGAGKVAQRSGTSNGIDRSLMELTCAALTGLLSNPQTAGDSIDVLVTDAIYAATQCLGKLKEMK